MTNGCQLGITWPPKTWIFTRYESIHTLYDWTVCRATMNYRIFRRARNRFCSSVGFKMKKYERVLSIRFCGDRHDVTCLAFVWRQNDTPSNWSHVPGFSQLDPEAWLDGFPVYFGAQMNSNIEAVRRTQNFCSKPDRFTVYLEGSCITWDHGYSGALHAWRGSWCFATSDGPSHFCGEISVETLFNKRFQQRF